jgi:hypothetical protein
LGDDTTRDSPTQPGRHSKYRKYLKTAGFPESDINSQIEVVEQQGRRLEAERWNKT